MYVCIQNYDNVTMYYCMYFYYIITCNVQRIFITCIPIDMYIT